MLLGKDKKKKVLVLWYTIGNNLGDYYIYKTVKDYLLGWGYKVIDMDVGLPYRVIARKAKRCEWLWFAGGGIIEREVPDIIKNFSHFHKKSGYINYGITGLSIGDFEYDHYKESLSYWINNAQFFYTRDDYSEKTLNRLANSGKIVSSADVVFASGEFISGEETLVDGLGINFRTMPYPDLTGEMDWKAWNGAIKAAHTGSIIWIPDQLDVSTNFNYNISVYYSPQTAVYAIGRMKYGIAMRFHVILISAMMGKICLPICYCPKVKRLADQLGISDLCIDPKSPDSLSLTLERYSCNADTYISTVQKNVKVMRERAQNMFNEIKILLREKDERKILV